MTNKHTPESQWVINYLMGIQRTGRHVPMATMLLVADSESAAITERDKLLAVNAELLYAIKGIINGDSPNWLDIARAAIARAEDVKQ